MSKKIKADMGKLEEIQTILENNARKKIVHIKSYRDFGYGSTEGVIEGREGEIGVNLNWDEDLPFKRDGDMAMLVWLENGENSLLPRMKPKDESNVGEE